MGWGNPAIMAVSLALVDSFLLIAPEISNVNTWQPVVLERCFLHFSQINCVAWQAAGLS
jgi:hypothetical protein